jgi:CRP/FNR family cyclic AMP-dependent transcriptional regulator
MALGGIARLLKPALWQELATTGIPIFYKRGEVLFRQGDTTRHVYVLLDGIVKVSRHTADGTALILTMRGAGDLIGDMAAMDGKPRLATVTAMSRVHGRIMTSAQFRQFISDERDGAMTTYVVERLREADHMRVEQATLPTAQRLARALVRLAELRLVSKGVISLPQEELASLIGASRNSVVNDLSRLRAEGVITTSRLQIKIQNRAALLAKASDGHHSASAQFCAEENAVPG